MGSTHLTLEGECVSWLVTGGQVDTSCLRELLVVQLPVAMVCRVTTQMCCSSVASSSVASSRHADSASNSSCCVWMLFGCVFVAACLSLQECLAAQQQRPLLAELESFLGQDKQLVVSCAGVQQFEILLQQFSGPLERQRWAELLPRLKVYHCSQGVVDHHQQPPPHEQHHSISSSVVRQQACAVCGETLVQLGSIEQAGDDPLRPQLDGTTFPLSQRLQQLERMSLAQQAVFGLGDALHALTLTANGSAVRAAAACGVVLDVHTHRPVWLTGL